MIKKLLPIIFLGLFGENAFADNHHHFYECKEIGGTNWLVEIEIDLKKNQIFRDGTVYGIGEKDDLYIYAKKKVGDKVMSTLNINRYNGKLNIWIRDKGSVQFNCEKLNKQF